MVRVIPIDQIFRHYFTNITLKGSGNKWAAVCPFHTEKTPSFIIYPTGQYHCFGCGAHGDGTDLVANSMGISKFNAALLIANDFGLQYEGKGRLDVKERLKVVKKTEEKNAEETFKQWCDDVYDRLCTVYRGIHYVLDNGGYERFSPLVHLEPYLDYLLDILLFGSDQLKFELLTSGEVDKWIQ